MLKLRHLVPLIALSTTAALAQPLDDPHLDFIPRTDAERERIAAVLAAPTDFTEAHRFERMSAGRATVGLLTTNRVFDQPSGNMEFEAELDFRVGSALFDKLWVSAPSSTLGSDGLGPLYNGRSCQLCHLNNGRGHAPAGPGDNAISIVTKISIPANAKQAIDRIHDFIATMPEPTYGSQLQDLSVPGHRAEFSLGIEYEEIEVRLSGGEVASLRKPTYLAQNLGYGPLHPDTMMSVRVAPQMIGLGLLEAIPAEDILALADPDDADGDGISGRPNIVHSVEFDRPMLGRFGHKAGTPTLRHQSAGAFAGDIGISSPLFPNGWGECTEAQVDCRMAFHGDGDVRGFEIDALALNAVTYFARNVGVPVRRDVDDPTVLRGKEMFHQVGCASCHQPSFVTHRLAGQPEQSFQLIWPYTDLLLHDMGPGLADNRPEALANGQEWRTPPLWGIGLTEQVSGHTYFLHDGRARSLLEAILWHGGEAQQSRDAVVEMPPEDRAALIRFLESL